MTSEPFAAFGPLAPYLVLILFGFLPSEVWRVAGVLFARRLDAESEVLVWVRTTAAALLAGVVAKLVFAAPGALAEIPLALRLAALAAGLLAYVLSGRRPMMGVLAGEAALLAIALLVARP